MSCINFVFLAVPDARMGRSESIDMLGLSSDKEARAHAHAEFHGLSARQKFSNLDGYTFNTVLESG